MSPKVLISSIAGATTIVGGGAGVYYLSQDRTIEHKLIRAGKELIDTPEEYEIAFLERKEDKELIKDLGDIGTEDLTKGRDALKGWCEKKKELSLTKENVDNTLPKVEKYCTKPSKTIEERYKKLGKTLIEEGKWKDKFLKIKEPATKDTDLNEDLKIASLGTDTDSVKYAKALKDWCNKQIKIELSKDKSEKIWNKVKSRCLQD